MSLLDRMRRRPQPTGDSTGPTPVASLSGLRVLRASGQRIDLSSRDSGARIAATRQGWQTDAWDYFTRIGELSYALRLLSRSVAKVRFYAAEIRQYPDDPVELSGDEHDLDKKLAANAVSELARLPLDDDGVDGFLATLTLNLLVAGEAWIHGYEQDGEEQWTIRSVSEITSHGDKVMLSELPTHSALGQRQIRAGEEELLRCWVRNPRYGQLATSPLLSALDIMEGIVLDGREARAAAQSRIAANGILLVPDSLSLVKVRQESEDMEEESVRDDSFMGDLEEMMVAPISNEGHAGAIVPVVIRGESEALKEVRHLRLDRADPEKLTERINSGVMRLLKSLDIQPEQVEGVGSTNHWSGWLSESKDVKQQVEPWSSTIAGCLTKAFLRPAVLSMDHEPDEVARVAVWRDISGLVENPNRGQDARDAHAAMVIKDATLRRALSFNDDDAPDEDEIERRIAAKAGLDQDTWRQIRSLAGRLRSGSGQVINGEVARELPVGSGDGANPARPGDVIPDQPIPRQQEPGQMVAAANGNSVLGWRVDVEAARALADIDAALADRIITAADAAISRAIERAGGRARSAVRKAAGRDSALTAAIDGVAAELIPSRVGREALLAAVSIPELLSGAFDRLRTQVLGWLTQAAVQVADATLRLLGLSRATVDGRRVHDAVTTELARHREAAWSALSDDLAESASAALFRQDPLAPDDDGDGERQVTLVPPAAVARALVIAGGGVPDRPGDGGMGTGPAVRDALAVEGAVTLGWEWQYRPERPRDTFTPHAALDGARFDSWSDPQLETDERSRWVGPFLHPNDHKGCLCVAVPLVAAPDLDDGVVASRIREARSGVRGRTLARMAAEDAAAGRRGTSVQRNLDVRDRIAADVERLRRHYIEGAKS